jgi:hypothetical protein
VVERDLHSGPEGTVCPCVPAPIYPDPYHRIEPTPTVPGLVWHTKTTDTARWAWDDFYKTTRTKPIFVGSPTATFEINATSAPIKPITYSYNEV